MNYEIKYYVADNGQSYIKDWLDNLDKTTRKRVLLRLNRLQYGNFGDYKKINQYINELRFNFGSGYRIYYTLQGNQIILLINAGDKKTQVKDIKIATEIVKFVKGQHNG